ncbi:hypothetical protein SK128_015147 [Halocaridina rubra]|uniref:Immunoglobulin-binding protein 1 n=1 Tax=Halocaridina rubra TaxID=373956 RepID=A0AAN9A146_HALRR
MEEDYPTVSLLVDKYVKEYEEICNSSLPTNSDEYHKKVKEAVDGLVKTTVVVSELGVFSSNENLEDLPTSSIKFLLLPVLLGIFTTKRTDLDRLEVLRIASIYFRDFMGRCKQYGITDIELPKTEKVSSQDEDEDDKKLTKTIRAPKQGMPTPEEAQRMTHLRDAKIRRFKDKQAIRDRLSELKKANQSPSTDEDVRRNYYTTLVKKFVYDSLEEIESIDRERKMLLEIAALKMKGVDLDGEKDIKPRPLKPILIARDAVQKNVFGLGYSSLPSMTVEEFYDQRVREGWFPDPSKNQNSLQDHLRQDPEKVKEEKEREDQEREEAEERDDLDKLERERERDDYKDTHRRGWGNTYNRS